MEMEGHDDNLPLVAFTTLAPLAAGGTIGLLLIGRPPSSSQPDWGTPLVLAVAVCALAVSFFHLGHPLRAYRVVARLSSSWLSREALLFGLFVLCLAAYSVPWPGGAGIRQLCGVAAGVLGFAALFATGKVYQLSAHPSWNHWATVASFPAGALSAGLALGIFASSAGTPAGSQDSYRLAAITALATGFLAVAVIVNWIRMRRLRNGNDEERASWRMVQGPYRWVLILRAVAAAAAAILLAGTGLAIAMAWVAAAVGELADRVLLFYTAVPVSPRDRARIPRFAQVKRQGRDIDTSRVRS